MANWIDRTINYLSPIAGEKRSQARIKIARNDRIIQQRAYQAAAGGPSGAVRPLSPFGARRSADTENFSACVLLRARSHELVQNNPYVAKAIEALTANIVGKGIRPRPKLDDMAEAQKVKDAFELWSRTGASDGDGQLSFYGLQRLACRMMIESGDVLIRRQYLGDGTLSLQLLEADFLDDYKFGPVPNGLIKSGVEISTALDSYGKRRNYWLYQEHPGDIFKGAPSLTSMPIPASEILHLYEKQRTQVRGTPWGTPSFETCRHLGEYELAEIIRKKFESCATGFIRSPDGSLAAWNELKPEDVAAGENPLPFAAFDANGGRISGFEPGQFAVLQGSEDITFNQPSPIGGYGEYKNSQLIAIAAGFRIPIELMTGDYSDMNFTSSRASRESFNRTISATQQHVMVSMFLDPVWDWWCENAFLQGKIDQRYIPVDWSMPTTPWTNPVDDAAAGLMTIRAGLRSYDDYVSEMGVDPLVQLTQIQAYQDKCTELGIVLDSNPRDVSGRGLLQKDQKGAPQTGAPATSNDRSSDELLTELVRYLSRKQELELAQIEQLKSRSKKKTPGNK